MSDQRGQLLRAALGFAGLPRPSYDRVLWALRTWLDSWAGIGHVVVGMARQGYDIQLTRYDERGWRATFYTTGMGHSPTSATGTGWEHSPWLTWDRIDLSRGVIRLGGKDTKSGRGREIPMRQSVYSTLAGVPGPREDRVFKTRSVGTAFENAVAEAKIDNLHFHDLRHHFASWFVMRHGALQALKEILGHADLKMTLRYAHLAPDHLRNEIEKTERPTQTAAGITHDITHEPVTREALSPK